MESTFGYWSGVLVWLASVAAFPLAVLVLRSQRLRAATSISKIAFYGLIYVIAALPRIIRAAIYGCIGKCTSRRHRVLCILSCSGLRLRDSTPSRSQFDAADCRDSRLVRLRYRHFRLHVDPYHCRRTRKAAHERGTDHPKHEL